MTTPSPNLTTQDESSLPIAFVEPPVAAHRRRVRTNRSRRFQRRGSMIVLIAILLVAFICFIAFSVDIAYMHLVRAELRTATDASARAAMETLSRTQDIGQASVTAKRIAAQNTVGGKPLTLSNTDIIFGGAHRTANNGPYSFVPGAEPINGVRINGLRTAGSASGEVSLFFGKLLNTPSFAPVQTAVTTRVDRDIVLVLDRSGSMGWDLSGTAWSYPPGREYCTLAHPALSRWAALSSAVTVFIDELNKTKQEEKLGMTSYSSDYSYCSHSVNMADIDAELTFTYALTSNAVTARSTKPIIGGTAIGAGIDKARLVLTGVNARKYCFKTMVVMTDGQHNTGRSPVDAAADAKAAGITVHTVTFSANAQQTLMKQVAAMTGGEHFHAVSAAQLGEVFRKIAAAVPVLLVE